nr:reverse transcriptase domain-containing protein [Tanacetum cinerariifolium]
MLVLKIEHKAFDVVDAKDLSQADAGVPKRDWSTWFKTVDVERPESPNPEWHKEPTADDAPKQSLFYEMLLEQAPRSPEYVPDPIELEDHVLAYIPEHPKDLLPAEDEAPIEAYIHEVASAPTPLLPPPFLSPRTPPLLPIPLHVPSTSRRAEILKADTPPLKRLLLTAPKLSFVDTMETMFRDTERRMMTALEMVNMRKDRAAVRAEIKVLRRERLAYEQESIQTWEALARSKAYSRGIRAHDALRSTNGDDIHNSGMDVRRTERATRESENQVKFATCTFHSVALTWWNTHVKTVGHDAAYGMSWKILMKMVTYNYCP